jgi:tetratricopeptide (TPR) repeat protein
MKWALASLSLSLLVTPALAHSQTAAALADGEICGDAVDTRTPAQRARLAEASRGADGPRAAFFRACELIIDGKVEAGVQSLESAARQDPDNPVYQFWLGRAYGEQAETASKLRLLRIAGRAKAAFQRAVTLAPDYLDGREGLMQYYLQAPGIAGGSLEKARAEAREIARRSPYRGALALVAVARKDRDRMAVVRAFDSAIAQFPDSSALYNALLAVVVDRKDWPRAWATIERFQRARPDSRAAAYAFGRIAALTGQRLEEGERHLREYLRHEPEPRQPSHAGARWRLGMILEHRGDKPGARREYQEAVRLDPNLAGAKQSLAKLGP